MKKKKHYKHETPRLAIVTNFDTKVVLEYNVELTTNYEFLYFSKGMVIIIIFRMSNINTQLM